MGPSVARGKDGVLRDSEIKSEWDMAGCETLNLVRFEGGRDPSRDTLQFHHTAVEAACRVLACQPGSPLSKEKGVCEALTSEAHKLQYEATVRALQLLDSQSGEGLSQSNE